MPLVHIELDWDDACGECYDCGLPAAFYVPDAYGPNQELSDKHKRCAICAANDASYGERVIRIVEDN